MPSPVSKDVPSSRDLPDEPRKDEARDLEKAIVEDADETDQADRERIHGDGKDIGLDPKK
ncbi:MAG: hypothetical protein EON84_12425 [Bradyrhizobiaceae bacterium]|jgi:hypothetical protein|nr:MAG: hypothetical protein EON84_12425 [Bradyrhizobiaceae bacterium]